MSGAVAVNTYYAIFIILYSLFNIYHKMKFSMKKMTILSAILALTWSLSAQPHYNEMLKALETHNPRLLAAQKRSEARQAEARVGVLLDDPQVEAAYYWGDPAAIGKRWDLSVSQSFEMPSVLVRRARLRDLEQQAAQLDYEVLRNKMCYETQQVCADLIYYYAVADIFDERTATAARLATLYQKRFDAGDCSILEYNRAQLYLAKVQKEAADAVLEAQHIRTTLVTLVGDAAYQFNQRVYDSVVLPSNFDEWYRDLEMQNPVLRRLDNQAVADQQKATLSRAQWLPSMSVGYASENVVGETFRGVTVGLSLPLWSQQRAVRQAVLNNQASQQELAAQRDKTYADLQCLMHHLYALRLNLDNLRGAYSRCNSLPLLDKALEAGEISLEEYLLQVNDYVDIQLQIWQLARQLEQAHLQFNSIAL